MLSMRFIRTPAGSIRRFSADRRGVVALMFGLMLLPMLGAIGLAIDFGNIMSVRTKAQMAADASALQASGVARDLIKAKDASDANTKAAIDDAKARAQKLFDAHAQQSKISNYTREVVITRDAQTLTSTVSFRVQTANFIGKVFGRDKFTAVGSATSTSSLPTYSDVFLALDISQSMGIASTQAGMNTLYNATSDMKNSAGLIAKTGKPIKCVFGCHVAEGVSQAGYTGQGLKWAESFSNVAKRYGVELRIDVLRKATKDMILTAQKDAENMPIYRIALYTMGMTADYKGPRLIELAALSNSFSTLSYNAETIHLGPTPGGAADSYINENLVEFEKKISASGDGSKQEKSKKYAFIVTDGLRNIQNLSSSTCVKSGGRCIATIASKEKNGLNPSCEALKTKGVTVAVLYTTYSRINPIDTAAPQADWFQQEVLGALKPTGASSGTMQDMEKVADGLRACASPGWFYQATDSASIAAAMNTMFAQTSAAPSLTQ